MCIPSFRGNTLPLSSGLKYEAEFDIEVIRLECGSNIRVPELGCRGKGSRTWTGSLIPEDGRRTLLRNARTHGAILKATTPCRPDDVSKDGGAAIFRVNPLREEFSFQDYTTPTGFRAYIVFPRIGGRRNAYGISPATP
jgi:hypothetical protein